MSVALRDVPVGWTPTWQQAPAVERPLAALPQACTPPSATYRLATSSGWSLAVHAYHPIPSNDARNLPPLVWGSPFGASKDLLAIRYPMGPSAVSVSPVDLLLSNGQSVWTFDYRGQPTALLRDQVADAKRYRFDDLVCEDLGAVVSHVCAVSGASGVWIGGISMGGVVAARFAELYPHRIAGLALIEAPVQWNTVPLWLKMITAHPALLALLPTRNLHLLLRALVPAAQYVPNGVRPRWARDASLNVRAHAALRGVIGGLPPEFLYATAAWVQSRLKCGDDPARARAIRCPVIAIVGADDSLAGPVNVEPFLHALGTPPAQRRYRVVPGADHYSLVIGRDALDRVYRPFAEMLAELS